MITHGQINERIRKAQQEQSTGTGTLCPCCGRTLGQEQPLSIQFPIRICSMCAHEEAMRSNPLPVEFWSIMKEIHEVHETGLREVEGCNGGGRTC